MPNGGSAKGLRIWQISVLAAIFFATVIGWVVGNIAPSYLVPISILAVSVAISSFSLQGNFWKPSWADSDPGLNVLRSLIVGLHCIMALVLIFMAVEAWFGDLDSDYLRRMLLKYAFGLVMVAYYSRRIANRSHEG
jgi:hypothetical protein